MDFSTLVLILLIVGAYGYYLYVGLIQKKNLALEALSTIDVQLKQRLDLIPNILTIAKKFMEHEKSLLTDITELRAQASKDYNKNDAAAVKEHLAITAQLSSKMSGFMLTVENYPDLKSDQTMIQAMQTYNEVEAQISAARRFYNSNVTQLNNAVEIFPGSVVANMIAIKKMPFFEAGEEAKKAINAADYLK